MSREPSEKKSEAQIEREVLLAVGRTEGLWIARNEVGQFFRMSATFAIEEALKPFGPGAVRAAREALTRQRVTCGLGVGSPDLVLTLRGKFAGWELKTPEGRVSPEQEQWHKAARSRGVRVDVIRSADEALAALAEMQNR